MIDQIPESFIHKSLPHLCARYCSDGKYKIYKHIEVIAEKISEAIFNERGRLIINLPPQHGKSLFISKWLPVWYLETFPHKKIILSTYEATFAAHWGRQVRDEFLYNDKLTTKINRDARARSYFVTEEGGGMFTAGCGGAITGKSGNLLVIDDPVKNFEEAKSPVYQQRAIDWFNSTLYTRKQSDTTIVLLMTRWHENDLTGYLLNEHADDWEHITIPALCDDPDNDILSRTEGEELCYDRFSKEDLESTKKAVGSYVWAGLYQQRPTMLEGGIIKRSWIKKYNSLPEVFEEIVQSWDLSFKKTTEGSFNVGQVWGRLGGDYYLLDQYRERASFPEVKAAIQMMSKKWPEAHRKFIEEKANGSAVIDSLKGKVSGLIPFRNNDSKEGRLSAVSAYFEAGNVFLPSESGFTKDLIEELCNFPNSKNDDQVDACSQAILAMRQRDFDISVNRSVFSMSS